LGFSFNIDSKVEGYFKVHYEEVNKRVKNYDTQAEAIFSAYKSKIDLF